MSEKQEAKRRAFDGLPQIIIIPQEALYICGCVDESPGGEPVVFGAVDITPQNTLEDVRKLVSEELGDAVPFEKWQFLFRGTRVNSVY